jgi:hypothetical protein
MRSPLVVPFLFAAALPVATLAQSPAPPGSEPRGPVRVESTFVPVAAPTLGPPVPAVEGADERPEAGRHGTPRLVLGGAVGGALGLFGGMIGGALLDGRDERCRDNCFGPGIMLGTAIGEAAGVAMGVHLANGRRGNAGTSILASTAILAGGVLVGVGADSPAVILAIPLAQLATSIAIERAGERSAARP